jgi:hypothetical protein
MAFYGCPLVKKMEFQAIEKLNSSVAKNIVESSLLYSYELYWNYENDLNLIMKIFHNPKHNKYFAPRMFNLLQG